MITFKREKPYRNYYHLYISDKKIKRQSNIVLHDGDVIILKEDNIFYSKYWIFYLLFNFLLAFVGSFDSFNDAKLTQQIVKIKIGEVTSNLVEIGIPAHGIKNVKIIGVSSFDLTYEQVSQPNIKKRISFAKKSLIIIPICILTIIAVILAVVLI